MSAGIFSLMCCSSSESVFSLFLIHFEKISSIFIKSIDLVMNERSAWIWPTINARKLIIITFVSWITNQNRTKLSITNYLSHINYLIDLTLHTFAHYSLVCSHNRFGKTTVITLIRISTATDSNDALFYLLFFFSFYHFRLFDELQAI